MNFFPIYWIAVSSVSPVSEILSRDLLGRLPRRPTLVPFGRLVGFIPYATNLANSLAVAFATAAS